MHPIRAYFNNLVVLSDEEWNSFEPCLVSEKIEKKTHLLKEGETCDFIAFIVEGTFRFYHFNDGNEKVTAFFFSGDFVTDYRSLLTNTPSVHHIESMQDASIIKFRKMDLYTLYEKYKNAEKLGRLISENLYLGVAKRLDSFLIATPEQRYQELLLRNSKIVQEIPQYMIASYLGIKPETLSRIRARK
jgi:CRP-like cAMP-binding protein